MQQDERADGDVEQPLADARQPPPGRKAVREDQPGGVEAVEIDAPGLALEEARKIAHLDARRLDPQQVVERQRVAPLLHRQHHLARAQREQMIGQAGELGAVDGRGDRAGAVVHADEADHREAGAARGGQRLDPRRPGPAPSTSTRRFSRSPPSRSLSAIRASDHAEQGEPHRVEQARPPEADRREDEEDEAQQDDAEHHRDQQPGDGEAQRLQRVHRIDADRDHRDLQRARRRRAGSAAAPLRDRPRRPIATACSDQPASAAPSSSKAKSIAPSSSTA